MKGWQKLGHVWNRKRIDLFYFKSANAWIIRTNFSFFYGMLLRK